MNKLMKIAMLFMAVSFLVAGSAVATPIFNGDPVATFGTGNTGLPTDPQGKGFYIWANDKDRYSWSVRWTGRDWTQQDEWGSYGWGGQIVFSNASGLQDAVKILWETGDGGLQISHGLGSDQIQFGIAHAGPHWDGFDFILDGVVGDYLTFSLDSTYLTVDNDGVYIGQDMVSVLDYSDSPVDFISPSGTNRQFEIAAPVPEPGTMVLLGLGLIGLVGLRRKIKK